MAMLPKLRHRYKHFPPQPSGQLDLASAGGCEVAVAGFGSTDCRTCPGHLAAAAGPGLLGNATARLRAHARLWHIGAALGACPFGPQALI